MKNMRQFLNKIAGKSSFLIPHPSSLNKSARGFTLIELLVVMGIMGILGTASVGGYRAMQRGMEERGVMQSVNSLIRSAYQRAQIDRQPTAIYFWNETRRGETADENEIVVGKAVAIRRHGRLSDVRGTKLVDEFGDLELTYTSEDVAGSVSKSRIYLYPLDKLSDIQSSTALKRSVVSASAVSAADSSAIFLSGVKSDNTSDVSIPAYAFECIDPGGIQWKAGMAYGLEFMQLELPRNYIFGSSYSKDAGKPIREAGTMTFDVGLNNGGGLSKGGTSGRNSITVYSLRPDGATLTARSVATSENPEKDL